MSVTPPAPAPFTLPTGVRVVLSLLAGIASVLNITTFGFGATAAVYISAALAFLAYAGIPPVTGAAFQNLLLKVIPAPWVQTVHGLLGAAIAGVSVLVATAGWSTAVTGTVIGVVTLLGALGFGPTGPTPLAAADLAAAK